MSEVMQEIPIEKLHLHLKNPRCLFALTEDEALYELIKNQGGDGRTNKLFILAKDIAKNGLSPTDLIMAAPAENGFTVREGNRRIAAIKCSLDPEIIPAEFTALKKAFCDLSGQMPETVTCHISDDENEINRLIGLKHNGQGGGLGVIPWNSEQRARFDEIISGKSDKTVLLIDYLLNYFGSDSKEKVYIARCRKTNLERMFGTPYVREKLGFDQIDSTYVYTRKNDALLSHFLERLSESNVGDIYYSRQRITFIDRLVDELTEEGLLFPRQPSLPEFGFDSSPNAPGQKPGYAIFGNSKDEGAPSEDTTGPENVNPRPKGHPGNRRTVIPHSGCPLHTEGKPHLEQLRNELKTLIAEETPMACGLVLRTLIEEIVDCYISSRNLDSSCTQKYGGRIQIACNELISDKQSAIKNNDVDYLRKFAQNNDDIPVSLSSLHSIAHGSAGYPDGSSLVMLWDKIYLPLRAMLDHGRRNN